MIYFIFAAVLVCHLYICQQVIMKCKYRMRWFSSKGAFLVLLWTLLIFIVSCSFIYNTANIPYILSHSLWWLVFILAVVAFVSAPLSGWLADAKFGNYKVFRAGTILLFIATVIDCLFPILEEQILKINNILMWIHLCLGYSFFVIGTCACVVTALPLGLDQMPDASSSSIASYIVWFICSLFVGGLLGEGLGLLRKKCLDKSMESHYTLILALLVVVFMSVVLASIFLFSPKWLIIEPKSPQSFRTIYQVLKFAAKHKAPINRSALTYWEEDIPSRIDLGKSKYGGPFTTEQVEDVKTVLRLMAISLPFAVIIFSFTFLGNVFGTVNGRLLDLNVCTADIIYLFVDRIFWYGLLGGVAYEFVIYPFIRNRLPSILKRIGAASFLIIFTTSISFSLKMAHYFSHSTETATQWIAQIFQQLTRGVLSQFVVTLILEFTCAQSPYNMRGLVLSIVVLLVLVSSGAQVLFGLFFNTKICTQPWCPLVSYSVQLVLHIFGFLLFCVVARWYKVRVRDEEYSPQRVVEEVYDRYLTAAETHSRSHFRQCY